jgi:lysozyme family protein
MKTPREAFANAITTWEGLYQADPADTGNIKRGREIVGTMRGVTPKVWAAFKGVSVDIVTPQVMRALSLEDAVDVYESFYYRGPGFDRLTWCAATEVWCDIGWGSGTGVAIKAMQKMIGEHPDGVIGPRTVERYNEWVEGRMAAGAVDAIANWRCAFYEDIARRRPANKKFLKGWLRRANYYRPANALWWGSWIDPDPAVPPIQDNGQARPAPVTPEEIGKREAETNNVVQGATIVGSVMASLGSFFKLIPPWALGVGIVALVGVGALWALRSFGIIRRGA